MTDPITFNPCPVCDSDPSVSIREVFDHPIMADGIAGRVGCTTCRYFDDSRIWLDFKVMVFTPLPCGKDVARYNLAELWNLHVSEYKLRVRVAELEAAAKEAQT